MSILGLDIGKKRIGAAVSDGLGITAQGLPTILYTGDNELINLLKKIIEKRGVTKIVIGLPRNLDGSIGRQAQYIIQITEKFKKAFSQEIIMWDEWFSTKGAERVLLDAGVKRKKRKEKIDKLSAQWILQGYLDGMRGR